MYRMLLLSILPLLFLLTSCAPEDDIIDNAINIYPDIKIKYYTQNDSLSAEVIFHSISPFGQPLRLIEDQQIWYNDSIMDFDLVTGKYLYAQKGMETFSQVKWIHDAKSIELFLDMNIFQPYLTTDSLSYQKIDSLRWDEMPLQENEYISIYMGDGLDLSQYLFHNTMGSQFMELDSSQINKFSDSTSLYLAPNRTKQFSFDLPSYRGNQGSSIFYADSIFTLIK